MNWQGYLQQLNEKKNSEAKDVKGSLEKLIQITNGKDDKNSKEINTMAKGVMGTFKKHGGISTEQANWLANTWTYFKKNG